MQLQPLNDSEEPQFLVAFLVQVEDHSKRTLRTVHIVTHYGSLLVGGCKSFAYLISTGMECSSNCLASIKVWTIREALPWIVPQRGPSETFRHYTGTGSTPVLAKNH